MSVATPFKSDGMGNGFPFCPTTIDVVAFDTENTDYDPDYITHWITLGGYSKDDFDASTPVTDAQIELSKQNAIKLFWNLEKVTGEASKTATSWFPSSSVTEVPVTSYPDDEPLAPKDRVCLTGIGGSVVDQPTGSVSLIKASIGISRMVAGATFLGYGIRAYSGTTYQLLYTNGIHAWVDAIHTAEVHVALWSMATQDPRHGVNHRYAYTVKNGIHFVGYSENDGGVADATVPVAASSSGGATARIDDLEFFPYP